MYKQFALTIAISVLLSAFNALTLTPALCGMLLRPPKPAWGPLGIFFKWFNKIFDVTTNAYVNTARILVRRGIITVAIVGVVILGAGLFAKLIPAGFIPDEDQGIFGVNVQLPPGASLTRSSEVLREVEGILGKAEGIDSYATIGGYGVVTNTYQSNYGTIFARLKPWEERHGEALHVKGIMSRPIQSEAFTRATLKSESRRIMGILFVLGALLLFVVARGVVTGQFLLLTVQTVVLALFIVHATIPYWSELAEF